MKISKKVLMAVCSCLLLSTVHAATPTYTPGELIMTGEIIEAACSIDPTSRDIEVRFGDISATAIANNDVNNVTRPFTVRLVGCSFIRRDNSASRYPYATIMFTGNATASDPNTLLPVGEASGFGIRLRDRNGSVLSLGKPSAEYELSDKNNILQFSATLVPIEQDIKAGSFYANAQFFMDYN
ncbi:fimbrial protein [Intestinirhabdus alba]|jgi:type 1 fimbria pilin|uniref:Fimbrial protein n=1 Tax=Intestinirhabdus alba TaxID=2899544 RepID=A0A6L6IN49_9ENTR|nr:fimbrial protein [Intestinirhabdus alba]MTH47138.1 fimbrial protein [Intestinirhabdus alba]